MPFQNQLAIISTLFICASPGYAQTMGTSGTIQGQVLDPSGAIVANAAVELKNPITKFDRKTTSDAAGDFRLTNLPQNPYHLVVSAPGFVDKDQDVSVRTNVPVSITVTLALAGNVTTMDVEATGATLVENVPTAHSDVNELTLAQLPLSPTVTRDSNGLIHSAGDHAQTSFSIDGQPISDQQSKLFSTQIPVNAIQSMELITGAPGAEYGDKTSLVVDATTKSGLGLKKPSGSFQLSAGSFGTYSEDASYRFGTSRRSILRGQGDSWTRRNFCRFMTGDRTAPSSTGSISNQARQTRST
jgi:hypothetical protein